MKLNVFLHAGTNTHKLKGKIARQELKKLFEFATSGTHFFFVGNYHDQTDRIAMGSLLGLVLANLFIGFMKKGWLGQFQYCGVLLCHQYDDDIICLFNFEQDAKEFLKFINFQHPYIKFTFEKQKDDKLAFLDVLSSQTDQTFCTRIDRKTT